MLFEHLGLFIVFRAVFCISAADANVTAHIQLLSTHFTIKH